MKKLLLVIAAIFCFQLAEAQRIIVVDIKPTLPPGGRPRTATITPKAMLNQATLQLSVSYSAPLESYDLTIVDQSGFIVCTYTLATDGAFYYYDLPKDLDGGIYTIQIEGKESYFEGEFTL